MKQILLVLGTRPEAIKLAPLLLALNRTEGLCARLLHSGQHEELTDKALAAFGITPDLRLPPAHDRTLGGLTAHLLRELGRVLERHRPDLVLVHGDTATAFAASLACFYARVPTAHVEAGLRSGDPASPFPEEFNRRAIALTAALHFAPTEDARAHLLTEGIDEKKIFVVGNTGIDALRYTVKADLDHPLIHAAAGKRLILFTAHRRESWGEPLRGMLRALDALLRRFPDTAAILPMHPNPLLRKEIRAILRPHDRLILTEPPEPPIFHTLLARATLVLTDSGGIQEEAAALGIPTLVMRDRTERPEGLTEGGGPLILTGTDQADILRTASLLLTDPHRYAATAQKTDAFGDGFASERIAEILKKRDAPKDAFSHLS